MKQSTKLLFLGLRRPADALKTYKELLAYTKSAVTRNYAEKTINGILDYVGGGKSGPVEVGILEQFYEATKAALAEARNDVSSVISHLRSRWVLSSAIRGYRPRPTSSWQSCGLIAKNMAVCRRFSLERLFCLFFFSRSSSNGRF